MASTNLSKKYQQKTDKQHILDNPDTYVGSVENVDANMWVLDPDTSKITERQIEYIPALYKLHKLNLSLMSYVCGYTAVRRRSGELSKVIVSVVHAMSKHMKKTFTQNTFPALVNTHWSIVVPY